MFKSNAIFVFPGCEVLYFAFQFHRQILFGYPGLSGLSDVSLKNPSHCCYNETPNGKFHLLLKDKGYLDILFIGKSVRKTDANDACQNYYWWPADKGWLYSEKCRVTPKRIFEKIIKVFFRENPTDGSVPQRQGLTVDTQRYKTGIQTIHHTSGRHD
jgi:hypothetical protein